MEDFAWLDGAERRAWHDFNALRLRLMGHLASALQRDAGLSPAEFEVLIHLAFAPGREMRIVDLGRALGWEKSRLSHQVTRMTVRGLLQRRPADDGGRGVLVSLSESGRAAVRGAAPDQLAHIRRAFLDPLTPAQLDELSRIARAVVATLDQLESAPDCPAAAVCGDEVDPCV